jgi:hypothetical protein
VIDTVIIGNNFNEKTMYYFGAQVFKGALGSKITTKASARDSTPAAGSAQAAVSIFLQNILKVKRCEYVTDFKAIRNLWQSEAPVLDYSLG